MCPIRPRVYCSTEYKPLSFALQGRVGEECSGRGRRSSFDGITQYGHEVLTGRPMLGAKATPKLLRAVVNHAVTFTVFEELSAACDKKR